VRHRPLVLRSRDLADEALAITTAPSPARATPPAGGAAR
jgi:hypothetical protein